MPTKTKKTTKGIQLQARTDTGNRMYFSYDEKTKQSLEFLQEFAKEGLSINPSKSVLIRRAIAAYVEHLQAGIADVNGSIHDVKTIDQLSKLQDFIQAERDCLFTASGRPERLKDRRYMH